MQFHKLILTTTFTPVEHDTTQHRHVLHQDKAGFYCYNSETLDGLGWNTASSLDLAKVLKQFMKAFNQDIREGRKIEILPA